MKGFVNIAIATPKVRVADVSTNTQEIENLMVEANGKGAEIVVFPELAVTGSTCGDLFLQETLLEQSEQSLLKLMEFSHNLSVIAIVGLPIAWGDRLFNCAAVIAEGKIYGLVPKIYIGDPRYFTSALDLAEHETVNVYGQQVAIGGSMIFDCAKCKFGIQFDNDLKAPASIGTKQALQGADMIFTLSAAPAAVGDYDKLKQLLAAESSKNISGYIYAAAGYGESTQDTVSAGESLILEDGKIESEGQRFMLDSHLTYGQIDVDHLRMKRLRNIAFKCSKSQFLREEQSCITKEIPETYNPDDISSGNILRTINPLPFLSKEGEGTESYAEIVNIQTLSLAKRIEAVGAESIVIGISGGLDSTLALLIAINTFDLLGIDRKKIIGITMPGFGTTKRTYNNATELMDMFGITMREISIREACEVHFNDISLDPKKRDATYENAQARERTQILMDVAGQTKGFVLGTGDLSELALGWTTYNGDHMSMYGINASVPKTLVRELVRFVACQQENEYVRNILLDIVATPISPELLPTEEGEEMQQQTENIVGPYELHDFFLYCILNEGYSVHKIYLLAQKAFSGVDERVHTYDSKTIAQWLLVFLRRFFSQQFKRSCSPDGPSIGYCSLSPRGDWQMPSDAESKIWISEAENILNEID